MLLPFLALLLTAEKCTLSGTVVDAVTGAPLNKTELIAEMPGNPPASTITGAEGNFTLVELDPGQYTVRARRNGYLDMPRGSPIALADGQSLADLHIKLTPYAVIAGTVRDGDGEPLANVEVSVFEKRYQNGRHEITGIGGATTDDLGQYRIPELNAGQYYVQAHLQSDGRRATEDHSPAAARVKQWPVPTFYPGAADPASAVAVKVDAGARVTGIDIQLVRAPLFRIAIHVETPAGLEATAKLSYAGANFGEIGAGMLRKNKQDIEIVGVPPGACILTASAGEPEGPFTGVFDFNKRSSYSARIPVQVGSADIEGLRVVVQAGAEVIGHIVTEGRKKGASPVTRAVSFDAGGSDSNAAFIKTDDTFSLRLSPSHYTLDLSGIVGEDDLYVKSAVSDSKDVLDSGIAVSGPGKIPIEITLASDAGKIEGTALDKDDRPVAGATVVLIPEAAHRGRRDLFKELIADQYGRFEMKGVAPGRYKLFAWNDVEDGAWLDPDFIGSFESKGEPVVVEADGVQTLKVHVAVR